jgi:hypothetical protein
VIWRQRLPVSAADDPERLSKVIRDLGRDLAAALSDPKLARKFLASRTDLKPDPRW